MYMYVNSSNCCNLSQFVQTIIVRMFFWQTKLNDCNFLQDISHLLDIIIMNTEFIYCEHLNNGQHYVHIATFLDVLVVNF